MIEKKNKIRNQTFTEEEEDLILKKIDEYADSLDPSNPHTEEEKIIQILRARMQAPSAKNQQPWKFLNYQILLNHFQYLCWDILQSKSISRIGMKKKGFILLSRALKKALSGCMIGWMKTRTHDAKK